MNVRRKQQKNAQTVPVAPAAIFLCFSRNKCVPRSERLTGAEKWGILIPSFDEEIGRAPDGIAKRRLSRPCRAWSLAAPAPGVQRASACCCRKIARREAVRAQRIIDAARRCSGEGRIAGLQFAKQRVPERCTERSVESMTLKECTYDYQRTAFWNYLCRCRR